VLILAVAERRSEHLTVTAALNEAQSEDGGTVLVVKPEAADPWKFALMSLLPFNHSWPHVMRASGMTVPHWYSIGLDTLTPIEDRSD
jgi:hypothetical protein